MANFSRAIRFCFKAQQFQSLRAFSVASSSAAPAERFHGRTAIVTGSTNGLGFAMARRLAQDGAYVVVSSRKQENVDRALATLNEDGLKNISGIVCDVTSKKDRTALIKHAVDKGSGIDILVANAGNMLTKPLFETTEEEWDQTFDLNLKSSFFLTKEALPHIKTGGTGSVVYISTVAAYLPSRITGAYNVSKTGLLQLAKGAAAQLGPSKIRVNCIAPAVVETDLTRENFASPAWKSYIEGLGSLKRLGTPEEIASVVAFLCSDDALYVTGECVAVTGGMHCRL